MLRRKGQPVRHTASQAPKSRHRGFRPEPPPWRTFGQAKKNSAPETRDGRSFKAGWRIASAGVINRHRFRCCKITLRLFHRCDSPVTIPGIWHYTHVAAAGKAARPHHPATKAACPDCKRRPSRVSGAEFFLPGRRCARGAVPDGSLRRCLDLGACEAVCRTGCPFRGSMERFFAM